MTELNEMSGIITKTCENRRFVSSMSIAEALYNEGYRKASDVAEVMYVSTRGVRPFIIACFGGKKYDNADFGKIVFLTRWEAEKALEERRDK